MQKPNGEWVPKTEEKTVDLDAIDRMTGSAAAIFGPGNGGHHERNITPQNTVVVESEEVPPEPPEPKEAESPGAEGEGETQGSRPAESDPFGDEDEEPTQDPLKETKETQ